MMLNKKRTQLQASIVLLLVSTSWWMNRADAWSLFLRAKHGPHCRLVCKRGISIPESHRSGVVLWGSSSSSSSSKLDVATTSSETIIIDAKQQPLATVSFSPGAAQNSDFDMVPVMDDPRQLLLTTEEDQEDVECFIGVYDNTTDIPSCVPLKLVTLPTHSHPMVNAILQETQDTLRNMHENNAVDGSLPERIQQAKVNGRLHENIYANNYVDMGKIDTYVVQACTKKNPHAFSHGKCNQTTALDLITITPL
jgi:hypothetical protein